MQTSISAIESYDSTEHPVLAALYDDDVLEVWAVAEGSAEMNDYGVKDSPRWVEVVDITVTDFEINGVEYTFKALVDKFGSEVADKLHEICADTAAEYGEWNDN